MLILSDSHGRVDLLRRIADMHRDADSIVFLGDGIADIRACERYLDRAIWQVAGNCDVLTSLFSDVPLEQTVFFGGRRILLTHGHRHGVKGGLGNLISYARIKEYDIVLYGHTHEPAERYLGDSTRPLYLFNPGSVSSSRTGAPSYGLLQIQDHQILLSHGEVPQ